MFFPLLQKKKSINPSHFFSESCPAPPAMSTITTRAEIKLKPVACFSVPTNKITDITPHAIKFVREDGSGHMQTHVSLKHPIRREVRHVRRRTGILSLALLAFGVSAYGQNQSTTTPNQATTQATSQSTAQKQGRSAGGDIGSGSGDIGKGAGKGAGNLAKGAGKGAGDLATLHPVDAAGAVGKGGASAGKNVAVGTAKGTGKIVKGTGKVLKKPF
jgi:hypothetical protein